MAATQARDYVIPDDIKELVIPVLAHRVLLSPEAQMRGTSAEAVLDGLLGRLPVPAVQG